MAFRRIVLAVDGSPPSDRAVEVCGALAAALGAPVTAVHVDIDPLLVVPPVAPTEAMIAPPILTDEALREAERAGEAVLERATAVLRGRGATVTTRRLRGPVGQRLVEVAKEEKADLIVLGSRGHGRLEKLLLGSVSDAVVRHARCSVLVVR